MTERFQAIVVGGGVVGCGILYGLAKRGMTNTLLLEKNVLTSGSTWHAAGNCTHFGHDAAITRLYVNSINTYLHAEAESGQSIDFHKTGSLRLASTAEELAAYQNLTAVYKRLGVPYEVLAPEQIPRIHPLMNLAGVLGAAHTPDDGHVDPSGATLAMAQSARNRGSQILSQHPVESIAKTKQGVWEIRSGESLFRTECVIVATSFWAREMLLPLGIHLPVYAIEHHEIVTESHPHITALDFELPTVRDPLIPGNIRQERDGLLIGVYEQHPVAWNVDGIPPEFGQELLEPNIDRLMTHMERCILRFPVLENVGIKVTNNGPLCFAPDGFPVLGPAPDPKHNGLWLATGFHVGIGTGGGAAQFLCDWIVNGTPPYPLDSVHPKRYKQPIPTDQAVANILTKYAAGYGKPMDNLGD